VTPLPRWRIVAGCLVLAALVFFAILFAPVYIRNLKLQSYVDEVTHGVGSDQQPDDALRAQIVPKILQKAHELGLPVKEDNVHIYHSGGALRIDVQYAVTVSAPFYSVGLRFYPGAGSR
jgi:hypothetical protein